MCKNNIENIENVINYKKIIVILNDYINVKIIIILNNIKYDNNKFKYLK